MPCPVEFCRKDCKPLPDGVEVFRIGTWAICETCGKAYCQHEEYYYPTGMGHAVRLCDGTYGHT